MADLSFLSDGWLEALGEAGAALRVQSGVDGVVRFVVTAHRTERSSSGW